MANGFVIIAYDLGAMVNVFDALLEFVLRGFLTVALKIRVQRLQLLVGVVHQSSCGTLQHGG